MKKLKYLFNLILMLLVIVACDPNKDINDAIDENIEDDNFDFLYNFGKILAEESYMLTEEDYALSSNESVRNYKNFSSYNEAEDYLGEILDQIFYGTLAQEIAVTYDYYRGGHAAVDAYENKTEYTLVEADYDGMGEEYGEPGRYDNFSSSTDPDDYLPAFIAAKYPALEEGSLVIITYDFYAGSVSERSSAYILDGGEWIPASYYVLSEDDYNSMGAPGAYDNFSSTDKPEYYLPAFLKLAFPYAFADDELGVVYQYYNDGSVETRVDVYIYDGQAWNEYQSTITKTSFFSYDLRNWNFVPPIKFIETDEAATREYTLTDADYELVGNGRYHNFDIRAGKAEEEVQVRIDKITTILKANFSDIAFGDVFDVTYDYYDGSGGSDTIRLKAVEDI